MPYLTSLPSLDSEVSTKSSSSAGSTYELSAMSDDGLKCFSHLKDSSPRWLSDITKLEQSIAEKQKEMANTADGRGRLVRNGSITSIREGVISNGVDGSALSPNTVSTHQSYARRPIVLTKRGHGPGSVASTAASGLPKFRSRSMVIVYYDAEIQKAFEKLVREIGSGRNLIRKARMAARMQALTSELDGSHIYERTDGETLPFAATHFRRAGERSSSATRAGTTPSEPPTALEGAERALERAQGLCEKAAHQFLRDGDCKLETQGTKAAFEEVLKISSEELPRLQASDQRAKTAPPRLEPAQIPDQQLPAGGFTIGPIEVDDTEDLSPVSLPDFRSLPRRSYKKDNV